VHARQFWKNGGQEMSARVAEVSLSKKWIGTSSTHFVWGQNTSPKRRV
jgi:hypothetical protein